MAFTALIWKTIIAGLHVNKAKFDLIQDNQDYIKNLCPEVIVCTNNKSSESKNLHNSGSWVMYFWQRVTIGAQVIDSTIDWRNRMVFLIGWVSINDLYPGSVNDDLISQTLIWDMDSGKQLTTGAAYAAGVLVLGMFFSGEGYGGESEGLPNVHPNILGLKIYINDTNITSDNGPLMVYVDNQGRLMCKRGTNGDNVDMTINGQLKCGPMMR